MKFLQGTHESDYFYDGDSRRVEIKELESGAQTKDDTFVWCESRICQKRLGSTVDRNYFEQGFEEGTSDYIYTRDHLGSVREVVGSDGTTIASRVSYDPWGKSTGLGSGAVADFGFTGHYFDRPTGLGLTMFRGFDPSLGRWLSLDPVGFSGGTNLYMYVGNNVPSQIDTTGLYPDAKCMDQIRKGCEEGARGKRVPIAVEYLCIAEAVALEEASPGSICKTTHLTKEMKRFKCLARCGPLLPDPQGDLQCMNFHRCMTECMLEQ